MRERLAQVGVATAAFAAMEPVAAVAHRWVMHGRGWGLHRSHHEPPAGWWQANDAFPVAFAGTTMGLMALGSRVPRLRWLLAAGAGITAYGAAYGAVHEVVIHRRLLPGLPAPARGSRLDRLRAAHVVHHDTGGPPYGMLWPRVPATSASGEPTGAAPAE